MDTTTYGMPYILEDKTGELTGSDFIDINDRLRLRLRCTAQAATHTAYMIHNVTHGHEREVSRALVALAFGPDHSLGTITFESRSPVAMGEYLRRVSPLASSKSRKFLASDGEVYRWSWRSTKGHEWTCTHQNQQLVASYSLKVVGEPDYISSSGCVLTIDEAYPHLAVEILATLTIMRHIVVHNL
ncbi:hypothetical protein EDC04DRAFT_1522990 [Pisolithus marmoratus]|nr:hypothetical protein EDC04DRAFT_1522990 [Pisolithus marmoratus]